MSDSLDINHIRVGDRHRKDFGDLDSLAASIKSLGLLAPIVVDGQNRLVAGHRRLEALRKLGWPQVPVRRVRQINDAVTALKAERDENTCRKDFTPSEAVALGMALEEMERPKAEERKASTQAKPGNDGRNPTGGSESPPPERKGKTRDLVAPAVGMKPSRYSHAKSVVTAQNDPDPEVAAAAKEATEDMDRTGRVETAYRKVRAARGETTTKDRIDQAKDNNPAPRSAAATEQRLAEYDDLCRSGYSSRQIAERWGLNRESFTNFRGRHDLPAPPADEQVGKTRKADGNRIIAETVASLEGICIGLSLVNFDELDLEDVDPDYWVSSLSESIRALQALRKNLTNKKELTSVVD